jgi:transcriptional regulator with XRE-family HTH domain
VSDLDAIRREVRTDLATVSRRRGDLDPQYEPLLHVALAELEPTEEWLEAVQIITRPADLESGAAESAISNAVDSASDLERPDLVGRRENSGLTVADAAGRLHISQRAMDQIEHGRPLGWVRISASDVASYLDGLGIQRGFFVRWLAVTVAAPRSTFAYGYRPGRDRPTKPVAITHNAELAHEFRDWAVAILAETD